MSEISINNFDDLVLQASRLPPARVAVVWATHAMAFAAVAEAQRAFKTEFHLIGNHQVIKDGLTLQGASVGEVQIHHRTDAELALRKSIELVRDGKVDILMKGSIDTSQMMKAVLAEDSGLRTGRLLSDIVLIEYPARRSNKFVMITDGGIVLMPDLEDKIELVNNAVEIAHILGNPCPKVAILSATELVLPNLQSTVDAAALTKMNQSGQIRGCIVHGPLALDNALSPEAAAAKGIESPVAGQAEILVAPNIESANILAKSTTYFGNLRLAHIVVGARIPILIPSRADKSDARVLSIALGIVVNSAVKPRRAHAPLAK